MPKTALKLTMQGKQLIADSMHEKGKAFLAASLLLQQRCNTEPSRYVTLHCFCQGLELFLKSLLLRANYDKYRNELKPLGHDLLKIVDSVTRELALKPLRESYSVELKTLNEYYSKHHLRYGGSVNLLIDPRTIPFGKTSWRVLAGLRLCEHKLRHANNS